jgi:hypothetical protein
MMSSSFLLTFCLLSFNCANNNYAMLMAARRGRGGRQWQVAGASVASDIESMINQRNIIFIISQQQCQYCLEVKAQSSYFNLLQAKSILDYEGIPYRVYDLDQHGRQSKLRKNICFLLPLLYFSFCCLLQVQFLLKAGVGCVVMVFTPFHRFFRTEGL